MCQQVFHVEDSRDVIQVFLVHGHTWVAVFRDDLFHLLVAWTPVNSDYIDAGTDDVDGRYVAETDNPFQNFFLVVNIRVLRQFQRFG